MFEILVCSACASEITDWEVDFDHSPCCGVEVWIETEWIVDPDDVY